MNDPRTTTAMTAFSRALDCPLDDVTVLDATHNRDITVIRATHDDDHFDFTLVCQFDDDRLVAMCQFAEDDATVIDLT